ncbi:peroxisomal sarcosine oxidase-like [Antedon mediterranea]|uniref:peroxisomal sarcosine oxidase-like n=1 Tax=Antedon mediterranea TaxID=105859 RepID=UPI003AF90D2D
MEKTNKSQDTFDCIVIGAGIIGSSTAYSLVKQTKHVMLLDQFCLPHTRGSSHGHTRVTRYAYYEDQYMKMMPENYRRWKILEHEVGKELYIKRGMLQIENKDGVEFQQTRNLMKVNNLPFHDMTPFEVCKKWPSINFSTEFNIFMDEDAGVLRADRCLTAFQKIFEKLGGVIKENEQVITILPGKEVTVVTSHNRYKAKSIVITPGAWASKVLRPLGIDIPLKVLRVNVFFWRWKECYEPNDMPTFVDTSNGYHIYGLPSIEYPGLMKICLHGGVEVDPDSRDICYDDCPKDDVNILKRYVKDHFPGLESTPSIVETCMYTNTNNCDPILDVHPHYPNIVIGCGFSGHGFKLAPAVGLLLSQLALRKTPVFDISHNTLSFVLQTKSQL